MKKLLINAPILSRSGYGEMARFALEALRQHEDKFDIHINVLNWGQTGFIFQEDELFNYITALRIKSEQYKQQSGGNPQYDISLQITIPNEWKRMAAVNIGYTAGIETTHISPAWLEPSNQMDKIVVISEHAKTIFQNTSFQDQSGNTFKVKTPIDVVHFPFKKNEDAKIDLELKYDFNFLTVNQWGPRKNMENLVSSFIDEFKDEEVGLVIKTNRANDSQMDKAAVESQLEALVKSKGSHKCKVYLVHGTLTEQEMHGLYRHPKIKAFVTATHGEGFGLPIFEAANEELPVIATNWSGHLDFLTAPAKGEENKPLFAKVDYEINAIQEQFVWPGVMEKGCGWAYPVLSHLKQRMREVYKDQGRFKSWAKKLSEHNKEKFEKQKVYDIFFYSLGLYSRPKKLDIKPINGLSFCIPTNGKRAEKTKLTINSIKKQSWGQIPYEIIVCGDISAFKNIDEVITIDQSEAAHTRKVSLLRNKAAEKAKYENIVFCDDDIILEKDWLEETVEYSKKNGWNVLSNKVLLPDGGRYWDRATISPHVMVEYEVEENNNSLYQSSAFFLVRKFVFEKVKWDETKLVYADREGQIPEDVQYSFDLIKNNFVLSFNKSATVWHNDDSYVQINKQCLKKDFIKEKMGVSFFPSSCEPFDNLVESL